MHIRNSALLFLLFCTVLSYSQEFVSLKWLNQPKQPVPTFEDAACDKDSKLPCYVQFFDLGKEFDSYHYEVIVEYPEYEALNKVESEAVSGLKENMTDYPEVKTSLGITAKNGLLEASFIPIIYKDGIYFKIKSFKLSLKKRSDFTRSVDNKAERYSYNSVLSKDKWIKIRVSEEGVYQISNKELTGMGFKNPGKVRLYGYGGLLLSEKAGTPLVDDLQEVPLWRENGYVLFYANGTIKWNISKDTTQYNHRPNHYSNYSYYFLTESEVTPKSFPEVSPVAKQGATAVSKFPDYSLYEKDGFSWLAVGQTFFEEYDYKSNPKKSYTLNAPGIISNENAWIEVSFSAYSKKEDTSVDINVNGTSLNKITIGATTGEYSLTSIAAKKQEWKGSKSEKVTVSLTHNRPSGVSGHLDYIRLNYIRSLALSESYLKFRGETKKTKFVISGANANTRVWNISDVKNYHNINGNLSGDTYTFTVDNNLTDEYIAVNTKGNFGKVEVVGEVPNQNLHGLEGIDMVIIVPPVKGLMDQAGRLAQAHRDNDGMKVEIVTSEQIYNEFSSGTPDATAYRNFMKMLYDRSDTYEEQPKYLLLFGDAAWDNRMITSSWRKLNPRNFLLCFESANSTSTLDTYVLEDYFGFLDDGEGVNLETDKLDIGIGRFPVRTVEEAEQVVNKTINYMHKKNAGPWKNTTCFLGDDEAGNTKHMEFADEIAVITENRFPELLVKKIYWDAYDRVTTASGNSYPGAHNDAIEQIKNGALIMAYLGHANPQSLSHEGVLKINDIKETITGKHAFWLTMGCDVGPFDSAEESFGEELILNPKGGAIGTLTSTRTTTGTNNAALAKAFIENTLIKDPNGKITRNGDALRIAKCYLVSKHIDSGKNKLQYVLLGDPAISLNDYNRKIKIEKFNSESGNDEKLIKAGSKVTVSGWIVDENDNPDDSFNGIIYPTVMDHVENLVTQGHDGNDLFKYNARTKKIFTGADSIRSGKFSFTFPVPMDISYSNESGLLSLYAIDNISKKEAKGSYIDFNVGGTEEGCMEGDSKGPKIFMYLNSPDFPNGGEVNGTPLLVAELEDEDGINRVGNGIGHDLTAMIDNSPLLYYVLNNYYTPDFGCYTKGSIRFSLPKLAEGKHSILLRAWDIKNNSSSSELDFNVNYSICPNLDVNYVNNGYKTTFIISHNRPEALLNIKISVCDYSGKVLWTHEENGVSSDSAYYMDWDMTGYNGQRLQPGIYLFQATLSSNGSEETSKCQKMVVMKQ